MGAAAVGECIHGGSNAAEAVILNPSTITFDANNYATPQRVVVQGIADDFDDGDQEFDVVFEYLHSEVRAAPVLMLMATQP